jgi:hypothetical protein
MRKTCESVGGGRKGYEACAPVILERNMMLILGDGFEMGAP